ncbi:MAG TPA: 5-oxoprolinase subunit PxpA [Pseudogracilibacillus sp.]|nr:5-oxoprolinase subunit PxpA [Pseudogracilibacillus sp.]
MRYIDLNSDLGEAFGPYNIGNDDEILRHVTSVNIACGFHAGDPNVMKRTVENALKNGVAIGAHPGFPDLEGFGRRNMQVSFDEAVNYIIYQVSALDGFVKAAGGNMQHVKPHGALYNMAATDYKLARAIAEGIYIVNPKLILMGLAGSELIRAGKAVGLQTASEVFADRLYTQHGTLLSRSEENAVIMDKEEAAKQVLSIVKHGKVESVCGREIAIEAHSICVHGDNEAALQLLKFVKNSLKNENIATKSLIDFSTNI